MVFFGGDSSRGKKASLVAQMVKNLPATQETWVQFLGWEDPLEEGMATHKYSCLRNPHGQRSLVGYSPQGRKESDTTERLHSLRDNIHWEYEIK